MNIAGPILVTGATGAQGGAVVDALLDAGADVRALVRNPQSATAAQLAERGVDLVRGDFEDPESLTKAVDGTYGVFSMQMPPTPKDPEVEVRTGRALVAAARTAGVEVFVHTSVARAGDHEKFAGWAEQRWWPVYWLSKAAVNDIVRSAGFPKWVVLKPAFMMDNFIPPKSHYLFPPLAAGRLHTALADDTRMHLIAAADVGRFAAAAFADPDRHHGQEIDLAADALTMAEVAQVISAITTVPISVKGLPRDEAIASGTSSLVVGNQEWANVEGYAVDLDVARSRGIALERFADWANRHADQFDIAPS
ncbi:NmrA family NAD(P)-binding protein [Mycobacterium sp. NBC_00419]|uniref:NmrA family NAD(P)-binding protein n=1 Tax=Mycobacterium sp. NBC_00419 TaxID=2975989 RepID=UPI002E251A2A